MEGLRKVTSVPGQLSKGSLVGPEKHLIPENARYCPVFSLDIAGLFSPAMRIGGNGFGLPERDTLNWNDGYDGEPADKKEMAAGGQFS